MSVVMPARDIMAKLTDKFGGSLEEAGPDTVLVKPEALLGVLDYLKNTDGLNFDYFNFITAADYYQYFEVVYHLTSLKHNLSVFIKTRLYDRDHPAVPSVVSLWQGADFQEREIFDLFGIDFTGHPNLKRIVLWEGFPGHPLRKDWNR
jgi:NADH-quinone oxidoreductase subunit C